MPFRELARRLATVPPLAGRTVGAGIGEVGERVVDAGDELAGDRRGGDLPAAAAGEGLVAGGEVRVPLGQPTRPAADMRAKPAGPLNATTSTVTPYTDSSIRRISSAASRPRDTAHDMRLGTAPCAIRGATISTAKAPT